MSPHRFARAVLVAGAGAFAGPGVGFLVWPARFGRVIDLALPSATAASDVRALFGGLELAVAALLAVAAALGRPIREALVLQLVAASGLLLGRVVSVAADGVPGPFSWLLIAIEVALAVAALVALRRLRAS